MPTAYEIPGFSHSRPSGADWSSGHGQYRFCTINSSGKVVYPSAGASADAVRQNKPRLDEATTLMSSGISFVEAGDVITAGSPVETDATGRAVPVSAGAVLGKAIYGAAAAGELVPVRLQLDGTGEGSIVGTTVVTFPFSFTGTSRDLVTGYVPGFAGSILSIAVMVTTATTDADADATINAEIGSTNVTGGVVTLADTAGGGAAATPEGKVISGTAITAANAFDDNDAISIEYVVTSAFSDGAGLIVLTLGA